MGDGPSETPARRFWRRVAPGLVGGLFIAYPMLVYTALTATTVRWASVVLLAGLLLIGVASRLSVIGKRPLALGILILALLASASLINSMQPLLFVPVAVNGSFLVGFAHTLFTGPSLIERFARIQHPDLTTAEARWCKQWTVIWCGFFALNIVVAGVLASLRELAWWTLYNGLVSYVLMGLLFSIEYIGRKYRFGRFSRAPWDRLLRVTFDRLGSRENNGE